jgi:hypothetical protein
LIILILFGNSRYYEAPQWKIVVVDYLMRYTIIGW